MHSSKQANGRAIKKVVNVITLFSLFQVPRLANYQIPFETFMRSFRDVTRPTRLAQQISQSDDSERKKFSSRKRQEKFQ